MSISLKTWKTKSFLYVEVIGSIDDTEVYLSYISTLLEEIRRSGMHTIVLDKRSCSIRSNLTLHTATADSVPDILPVNLADRVVMHEVVQESAIPMQKLWAEMLKQQFGITLIIHHSLAELFQKLTQPGN